MKERVKYKTYHGINEKKGKFGSPKSELICFKGGTPIMLGPKNENHKPNIAKMKFILLSLVYWTF